MSVHMRTLLVSVIAIGGLTLGLGTASAAEAPSEQAPSSEIPTPGDALDVVNDLTGPVIPPVVNDIIGGLYG